jgi:crooked neck
MAERTFTVQNKAQADVQITAEEILRLSAEQAAPPPAAPRARATDTLSVKEFQLQQRREFEAKLAVARSNKVGVLVRYAKFEESQRDFVRARSLFERAIEVDPRSYLLWQKYVDFEIRNRFVNHARNVLDRAVAVLPRSDQLWLKYVEVEETLGNIDAARAVFQQWMQWNPDERAWKAFIKFETKYRHLEQARAVFERFIDAQPEAKRWVKFAKFEEEYGNVDRARTLFETALKFFGDDHVDEALYIAFARFEERQREFERARVIYRYGIDHLPRDRCLKLYDSWCQFEKVYGDREGIDALILEKKRVEYQESVRSQPYDYDTWFDYTRLEELLGRDIQRTRFVYEEAISKVPSTDDKRFWRRYIYLWIRYAVWEETETQDVSAARTVYRRCLDLIPHAQFSFSKIWVMYASFELRQMDLVAARKVLGSALGKAPKKDKIFAFYIDLERQLNSLDRCRTLYEKYVAYNPANADTWLNFARLEIDAGEEERARAIFDIAVQQDVLSDREKVWDAYLEFEEDLDNVDRMRQLYGRLVASVPKVGSWVKSAVFEAELGHVDAGRSILQNAVSFFAADHAHAQSRADMLVHWRDFEAQYGDDTSLQQVVARLGRKERRVRPVLDARGEQVGSEEYFEWVFPDDHKPPPALKMLEIAQRWKMERSDNP